MYLMPLQVQSPLPTSWPLHSRTNILTGGGHAKGPGLHNMLEGQVISAEVRKHTALRGRACSVLRIWGGAVPLSGTCGGSAQGLGVCPRARSAPSAMAASKLGLNLECPGHHAALLWGNPSSGG